MDIKIKGDRLKNLLSYDWLKIVLSIVAGIVVWSLLFTTLGTRSTVGEEFVLQVYENVYTNGSSKNNEILNNLKKNGSFSYDVLTTQASTIMSAGQYSASYMLSLRMETQEGDVLLISDGRAGDVQEGKDATAAMQTVVNAGYLYNIQDLLNDASFYCSSNKLVIVEGNGQFRVNETGVEEYFRNVRLKSAKNYKRTFRTEAQKLEGIKLEKKRIEVLYSNYLYVSQAIEKAKLSGNDFLWYGEIQKFDSNGEVIEGEGLVAPYGIDLYKLNSLSKEGDLKVKDTWYTYAEGKTTAEGVVACVFNFKRYQPDLQYETLAFLRYLIETYSEY